MVSGSMSSIEIETPFTFFFIEKFDRESINTSRGEPRILMITLRLSEIIVTYYMYMNGLNSLYLFKKIPKQQIVDAKAASGKLYVFKFTKKV